MYPSALGHAGRSIICIRVLHYSVDVQRRFATVPTYLADLFSTQMVGAIHMLLTAWAPAGVLGPVLVNYIGVSNFMA
jgi:hypothetical protein